MQTYWSNRRRGSARPALVAGILLAVAAVAVGAWYFTRDDVPPGLENLQVTVDGKKVDAKDFLKNGTVQLAGGGSFSLAKEGFQPQAMMADTFKEFFALPEGPARTRYLDDHIDKQQAAMKDLNITSSADGMPQVKVSTDDKPTTQPKQKIQLRMSGSAGDSMPPEFRAQIAEFAAAVAKRRAERGLPPQQGVMMLRTGKKE